MKIPAWFKKAALDFCLGLEIRKKIKVIKIKLLPGEGEGKGNVSMHRKIVF